MPQPTQVTHTQTQPQVVPQHTQVTQAAQWGVPSALGSTQPLAWHQINPTPALQMHDLRTNSQLRATADEKLNAMEQTATPTQRRRISGRYNYKECLCRISIYMRVRHVMAIQPYL